MSQVGIQTNFLTILQVIYQLKKQDGTQVEFHGSWQRYIQPNNQKQLHDMDIQAGNQMDLQYTCQVVIQAKVPVMLQPKVQHMCQTPSNSMYQSELQVMCQ